MTVHVQPDPLVVERQNDLFDLWHDFAEAHADDPGYDPDDDPAFHEQARLIMGIPRSLTPTEEDEVSRAGEGFSEDDELLRAMAVDGDEFQAYWTRGKGLARWATKPHPWRTLRRLLRKHPAIHDAEGLASHYFHVVFGIWPGERKGDNPVGPG